jgi:hypothetical protein
VDRLLSQTIDCAYFVTKYIQVESFSECLIYSRQKFRTFNAFHLTALRAVVNAASDADKMIGTFEKSFRELKIEFIMGSSLQTAMMATRILDKVDNVGESSGYS